MALNRSDKSRILRRYFPGMTRNSEMSTEPSAIAPDVKPSFETITPFSMLVSSTVVIKLLTTFRVTLFCQYFALDSCPDGLQSVGLPS